MNWKKIAIERLKDYETRKQSLETISEQLKTLEMNFTAIRAATTDATAVKPSGNKREDALIHNIVSREELKSNLEIVKREIETTEKGLKRLSGEQRRILEQFYVYRVNGHVERLCEELCVERSRVYELKDEALKIFTIACYGVVEI